MQFTSTIGYLLHHLAFKLNAQSNQVLQTRYGIGFAQFKILLVLEQQEGLRQRDIATSLGQTEASISRQIKILKTNGFIETRKHKLNKRERRIYLTLQGEHMLNRASYTLNSHHSPLFESLSEKQQEQLRGLLSILESKV
jgi:DNA-binding MarR family transcriptional regulator